MPFFSWTVYSNGLVVKLTFVGEGLIQLEDMQQFTFGRLMHKSKVLRGPIRMPGSVSNSTKELF